MKWKIFLVVIGVLGLTMACEKPSDGLDETPFKLEYGNLLPKPKLPADNPLTVQKVKLGRMLFYEKMLSRDNSMSCASCHKQDKGFSDENQFSEGIRGELGRRQSMAVLNMAWNKNKFFWDGRADLLRHQSLLPIEDDLELDDSLPNVINKIAGSEMYQKQFIKAFGDEEVTAERMSLAMEQFMLTIVSFNSKYDKYLNGEVEFTESEKRGEKLFITEFNPAPGAEKGADCVHCHSGFNFENDAYLNNGLDAEADIKDIGRQEVTMDPNDKGKFKVPTLRNIALTAPYMHDGRFTTLEEVVEHYNSGIKNSSTIDGGVSQMLQNPLNLTQQEKTDLVNFMKTLTDESIATNKEFSDPF